MRVDIQAILARERHKRLPALIGEVHGEAGWSRDSYYHLDPARQCFLHNLEGGAPAHHEDRFVQRQHSIEQRVPEHLIHCIVTANIFPRYDRPASECKQAGGMETSGAIKRFLPGSQLWREIEKQPGRNHEFPGYRRKGLMHRLDGRRPAKAATRRGKDMARESCKIDRNIGTEEKIDRIAIRVAWVRNNLRDLVSI